MFAVAGVDPLRAVTAEKTGVEGQSAFALDHRDAFLLGAAGVDGTLEDGDPAGPDRLADRFAGAEQRRQVRRVEAVHRSRHGDDEDVAVPKRFRVGGITEADGLAQLLRSGFERIVSAASQLRDPRLFDVESDGVELFPEGDRQRQPDIAEADDGDFYASIRDFRAHEVFPSSLNKVKSYFLTYTQFAKNPVGSRVSGRFRRCKPGLLRVY